MNPNLQSICFKLWELHPEMCLVAPAVGDILPLVWRVGDITNSSLCRHRCDL